MYKKKVILEIESVYTANAFRIGPEFYVGAGSETTPQVYLYNIASGDTSLVTDCPGGMMSFIPIPGSPGLFVTIQGLFPPFIGAEAGLFLHRRDGDKWETSKALDLPFAHRCEILNRDGENYLFAATVSKHKDNPQDWSKPGDLHLIRLEENPGTEWKSQIIDSTITRNHGMARARINGLETICISGVEGIYYLEQQAGGEWIKKPVFDKEVSEMCFLDLDGDGNDELVTIEPFHGERLNVYKKEAGEWQLKFSDSLSFGHGLCAGIIKGESVIVVGNRRGSFALKQLKAIDLMRGQFSSEVIEEDAGPTQTQIFSVGSTDYILSANQKKNEVALYS